MPLLSVLWGVALMSLVAASLLSTSGASQRLARNAIEAAQTDGIAEAAIVRTVVGLTEPRPERRWRADGRLERFSLAGGQATVQIQDELGRIDLNYADRSLLFGLLRAVDVGVEPADKIVNAILEWRSKVGVQTDGSQPGTGSASADNSIARHGSFQSVDEVRLVQGMTAQIYRKIAPALTVYSQRQMVDPQLAPREVLLALPGMTPDRAAQAVSERSTQPSGFSSPESLLPLNGRTFSLRIEVERATHKRVYSAVIRLTDDQRNSYWLLDWQDRLIM